MIAGIVKPFLLAALDYIYPRACVCCYAPLTFDDSFLCQNCHHDIVRIHPPICETCGSPVRDENLNRKRCGNCPGGKIFFEQVRSELDYNDERVHRMIHAFKFEYFHSMAAGLSEFLFQAYQRYYENEPIDGMISVPLHKRRQRHREFNQSQLLTRHLADKTNIPQLCDVVIRNRWTRPQVHLKPEERSQNVRGAYTVIRPDAIKGKNLLIVDDIVTTGSTVNELSKELHENGAKRMLVLSLARAYTQHKM